MVKLHGGFLDVGDTLSYTYGTGGFVTSSGTAVHFLIPVSPLTDRVTSVKVSRLELTVRQNGNYLLGDSSGGEDVAVPNADIRVTLMPGCIHFYYKHTSQYPDVVNNSAVGVYAKITLTFE